VKESALTYAARGWPVFPSVPGRKEPLTDHGFLDASTDVARIEQWWRTTPNANVAIATGAPGPDVLDVDVRAEGSGWATLNRIKRAGLTTGACMAVSTRNGGVHLYYAGTEQSSGKITGRYLDFKAARGYVLAPPSLVPADDGVDGPGRYVLLDERDAAGRCDWAAIRRLVDPPPAIRAQTGRPGRRGARALDGALRWLAAQPADDGTGRHLKIKWAAEIGAVNGADESFYDQVRTVGARLGLPATRVRYNIEQGRRVGGAR